MKVIQLRMKNYRRYFDQTVEFPDGVTAVIGPNGSGKSTLLEAIGFALYGAQATRTPKALLRNSDAPPGDAVEVSLLLELDGQTLHVVRQLRGENLTPKASLAVDDKPLVQPGANSNAAVTEEIERLLGMDRHAFFTTIVAQQKDLARLADLPPNDRKQLILRMLGIDGIDKAIQQARESARRSADRLEGLRSQQQDGKALKAVVQEAKQALDAATVQVKESIETHTAATTKLATATAAHEEQVALAQTCDQAENAAKNAALQHANAKQAHATAQAELQTTLQAATDLQKLNAADPTPLRQQLATAEAWHEAKRHVEQMGPKPVVGTAPDLDPLQQALDAAQREHERISHEAAGVAAQLKQTQNHLRRLQGADADQPCPVCQRPMEGHLPQVAAATEAEHLKLSEKASALQKQLANAAALLQQSKVALTAGQEQQQAAQLARSKLESWQQQHALWSAKCEGPAPDVDGLKQQLAAAEAAHGQAARLAAIADQWSAREEAVKAATETLEDAVAKEHLAQQTLAKLTRPDVAKSQTQLAATTQAERAALQARNAAEAAVELVKTKQAHATEQLAQWDAAQKRIRDEEEEARYWTALAAGRGRGLLEQFRSHMVGRIRPAINAEASRLLARFTNGRYTEMLLDDDYNLYVRDGGTPYTANRFSGGETDLVHLALRLAVSRLLAQRSGAPELRFLALDEVFGSLDESRRASVLAALHGLGGLYTQVLLVTHHEALRDALDGVLSVREENGMATIQHG